MPSKLTVRSARAAFDAQDDHLQRAAGLARHARIELLSRRVDAAMDEAVEASSLLDPELPASPLLVHTLSALAGRQRLAPHPVHALWTT